MKKTENLSSSFLNSSFYPLLAMVLTSYLFYLDEGHYNFEWTKNLGNWLVFALYTILFTSFMWLIHFLVSLVYRGRLLRFIVVFTFIMTCLGLIFIVFK